MVASSPGVGVRFFRDGDEHGLLVLLERAFEGWPKVDISVPAIEHLRWKLASAPSPMRYQVVAVDGHRVVGCRLFFLMPFRVHGATYFVRSGFDLAIDPEYRGRRILEEMWSFARKHLDLANDFNFGVGDHPAALRMRATQGNIRIANRIEVLVQQPARNIVEAPLGIDVVEASSFDQRVDALFEQAAADFDFLVERRQERLNWRHSDPRAGGFAIKQAETGGRLLGYAALRISRGRGYIADLLSLPGEADTLRALLSDATCYFQRNGVQEVDCWVAAYHPYRQALADAGFTRRRRKIPLSYRHLRLPAEKLAFLRGRRARIHIMAADTDLV
jgi:hypothetical protein